MLSNEQMNLVVKWLKASIAIAGMIVLVWMLPPVTIRPKGFHGNPHEVDKYGPPGTGVIDHKFSDWQSPPCREEKITENWTRIARQIPPPKYYLLIKDDRSTPELDLVYTVKVSKDMYDRAKVGDKWPIVIAIAPVFKE